jgi:hypothetical protein
LIICLAAEVSQGKKYCGENGGWVKKDPHVQRANEFQLQTSRGPVEMTQSKGKKEPC